MVFILESQFVDSNNIKIDPKTQEPMVTMQPGEEPNDRQGNLMKKLTASAMESLRVTIRIEFICFTKDTRVTAESITLKKLELGGRLRTRHAADVEREDAEPLPERRTHAH